MSASHVQRGRHTGLVKSQERREQEIVTISTGLLLFAGIAAIGGIALTVVHQFAMLQDDLLNVLVYLLLGGAGTVGLDYVYRHRGR
jgi:hypothetical protein